MAKKKTTSKKSAARKSSPAADTYFLHIITASGGTLMGDMLSTLLTQFPGVAFRKVHHPFCDTREKVEEALAGIDGRRALVVHALADPRSKAAVRRARVTLRIPHHDLTGPLVHFIADQVGVLPANDVTRLHATDESYFRRIAAMEFAMEHDDGLGLDQLDEAEIVIVGLSRVSKSPTSMFLASKGYKTANVSISPETGFPAELAKVKKKIIALTVQPKRLQEIRAARFGEIMRGTSYSNLPDIIREVMEAEAEYHKRRYPVLDITELTVEQTAAKVLETLGIERR